MTAKAPLPKLIQRSGYLLAIGRRVMIYRQGHPPLELIKSART